MRGIGLLLGLEFKTAEIGYEVASGLFGSGVLVGGTLNNAKTLRLEPPAVISQEQLDEVLARLEPVLAAVRDKQAGNGLVVH